MKKLLLIAILISVFSTAFASKADWTYAFYIKDGKTDISKICDSFKKQKNIYISIYYNKSVTNCEKSSNSAPGIKEFFTQAKDKNDSWKYLFAISADNLKAEEAAAEIGLLRPTLLILDTPDLGKLENLYALNNTAPYISVFADDKLKTNFDYASFLSNPYSSPEAAEAGAVETVKKQTETSGEKAAFFTLETGGNFEGFLELYDTRAKCFDKKIDRFERIHPAIGHYTDTASAANIINRMLNRKLMPVVKSSFSNIDGVTGPLLFYPKDKTDLDKTKTAYKKSALYKKYPNWLEFLEVLHVKK